ncbi:hypothetical protein PIB30_009902 [Stylosanthes scabra]|uniref:Uncharacterized protein n=1 Tax=Stylosanthes scabra TaxID=79078 RepID=A0ABU6S533_9FABA|nr:hypothetical protein [Stylosanthes scabra]
MHSIELALESAIQQLGMNELFRNPLSPGPNAFVPVITVVNLCRRDLTLCLQGCTNSSNGLNPIPPHPILWGLAVKILKPPNAYAWKPNLPNGRDAQGRDVYAWLPSVRTHGVQKWPSRFCCDLFVPFALFGHFRSELYLLIKS